MKLGGLNLAILAIIMAGMSTGIAGRHISHDGDNATLCSQGTEFEKSVAIDDIGNFVKDNYDRLAIDTTGVEPMIAVRIETDGNFKQLESLGLDTGSEKDSRWGNFLSTIIPVRMISDIMALESVKRIDYSLRGKLIGQNAKTDFENPNDGEVAGQISGLEHSDNSDFWIFLEVSKDSINSKTVMNDSIQHFGTILNQNGMFRMTGIPCGSYKAIICRRHVSGGMILKAGQSKCDTTLMIVDAVIVRKRRASIIDIFMTSEMMQNLPAQVEWKPQYRP